MEELEVGRRVGYKRNQDQPTKRHGTVTGKCRMLGGRPHYPIQWDDSLYPYMVLQTKLIPLPLNQAMVSTLPRAYWDMRRRVIWRAHSVKPGRFYREGHPNEIHEGLGDKWIQLVAYHVPDDIPEEWLYTMLDDEQPPESEHDERLQCRFCQRWIMPAGAAMEPGKLLPHSKPDGFPCAGGPVKRRHWSEV